MANFGGKTQKSNYKLTKKPFVHSERTLQSLLKILTLNLLILKLDTSLLYRRALAIRNIPSALPSRTLSVDLSTSRAEGRLGRFNLRPKIKVFYL